MAFQDMHYAEFAEDEVSSQRPQVWSSTDTIKSAALREAIKEYEANKWKAIGQKLGKPAKVRRTQYQRNKLTIRPRHVNNMRKSILRIFD